jgi:Zn-dependent M28 family amino/carboxypeptidase
VGALIELARHFRTLRDSCTVNLRFISFGAEEKGMLGSRIYLNRHKQEMKDCVLMFNMDFIGGQNLMIEVNGDVASIPETVGLNQFPEKTRNRPWEGIEAKWRILEPDILDGFGVTNKPEWLVDTIRSAIEKLDIPIRETGNLGADQQTFAQAGVPATSIGASGNQFHNPNDIIDQVNPESLQKVGLLVSEIILSTMRSR